MHQTSTALLIEHKLGRSLAEYVAVQQSEGLGWRRIAERIERDTGVKVSYETLRTWASAPVATST
jgi:hypothetical protein